MNERPDVKTEVLRWVEKADNDLRNAEYVSKLADACPTDTVCFHCQQCAEKYLKALLISRSIAFPRTHDLVVLLNLAASIHDLTLRMEHVQPLNRYSIEGRYPGDWDPIDLAEANKALAMAREVRAAVRTLLPTGS
jgi:HEPN domain-containing protein